MMLNMSKKTPLPIGISSFSKTRKGNYYYVDKSMLIHELLDGGSEVTLFTRPRRFGKTLNMDMLHEFFDNTKDSKHLFVGLKIEESPFYQEINSYPTLFFSFRESKGSQTALIVDMKKNIFKEYEKYYFIRDSLVGFKQKQFDIIVDALFPFDKKLNPNIASSIEFLTEILSEHYNKPVILIIDEYDTPMENAYNEGYYNHLKDFFRGLYASVLKDNHHLKMGVLTGIQRIAKENIFSGLNNLRVNTVKSNQYGEFFGLLPEETEQLLNDYSLELTEDVTKMYNGYCFGSHQIYNPWSVLNYADTRELSPFWVNTASNTLIQKSILESSLEFKDDFEKLIAHGSVKVPINTDTAFSEQPTTDTLWGLLLNAGYITLVDTKVDRLRQLEEIRIPNIEVKREFQSIMNRYARLPNNSLARMFDALIYDVNLEKFKEIYKHTILTTTSYYDSKENAYHMMFLGMCISLDGFYEVKSNIEVGSGRCDIMLKAKTSKYKHIIIEFKQGNDVKSLAQDALAQIKEKQYYAEFSGDVVLMGIAHNIKECEMVIEEISL